MNKAHIEEGAKPVGHRPTKIKEKPRTFWRINWSIYSKPAGIKFLNKELLTKFCGRVTLGPPPGKRGFLDYPEAPKLLIDKKLGRPPGDLEAFFAYWLISSKTKSIFEALDRDAFAFCKCETSLPDGAEGPEYWLCDVLPELDAVDEKNSLIKIEKFEDGSHAYVFVGFYDVKLREDIIEDHKIFRLLHAGNFIICNDDFKNSCKVLENVRFNKLKNP
jgi:hypothetical protein